MFWTCGRQLLKLIKDFVKSFENESELRGLKFILYIKELNHFGYTSL